METVGTVELRAEHESGPDVAHVRVPGGAVPATTARGDEGQDHVVPGRDPRDSGPDFLDHAGTLVTADDR